MANTNRDPPSQGRPIQDLVQVAITQAGFLDGIILADFHNAKLSWVESHPTGRYDPEHGLPETSTALDPYKFSKAVYDKLKPWESTCAIDFGKVEFVVVNGKVTKTNYYVPVLRKEETQDHPLFWDY